MWSPFTSSREWLLADRFCGIPRRRINIVECARLVDRAALTVGMARVVQRLILEADHAFLPSRWTIHDAIFEREIYKVLEPVADRPGRQHNSILNAILHTAVTAA